MNTASRTVVVEGMPVAVPFKEFSTGSDGYRKNGNVIIDGVKYAYSVQFIRDGSKTEPDAVDRAIRVLEAKQAKQETADAGKLAYIAKLQASLARSNGAVTTRQATPQELAALATAGKVVASGKR